MWEETIWTKFSKNSTYVKTPNELDKANIKIDELEQENKQLKERINFATEDLNQLQEAIFGGDEYLNWIVSEIEKVKIKLLGDSNE